MDRRNAAIQVTQQMEPKKERMMIEWGEEARQQRRKSEREPDTPSERERERKEMSNNRGPGGEGEGRGGVIRYSTGREVPRKNEGTEGGSISGSANSFH